MNARGLRIAVAAAEVEPFVRVGGLGPTVLAMAEGLAKRGHRVQVFLPGYRTMESIEGTWEEPPLGPLSVPWDGTRRTVRARRRRLGPLTVWRMDEPGAFGRPGVYVDPATGRAYGDDLDRWGVFCRAVAETMAAIDYAPDLVHVHDYHAAFLPLFLRRIPSLAGMFRATAALLTVHNGAFTGRGDVAFLDRSGLGRHGAQPGGPLEFWGTVSALKAGLLEAERSTTVSPRYAEELRQDAGIAAGLDGVYASLGARFSGIRNGIDTAVWNPAQDPHLAAPFTAEEPGGKRANREALLRELGLEDAPGRSVLCMIARLVEQKGIDLVLDIVPALLQRNVALVVLGRGEARFADALRAWAGRYPDRIAYESAFNEPLSHRIQAGADVHLVPSRFEPCGLAQLIAMRYGTLPVARRTGGLADTIRSVSDDPRRGTGFLFEDATPVSLLAAIDRALALHDDRASWAAATRRAMGEDVSWSEPIALLERAALDAVERRGRREDPE